MIPKIIHQIWIGPKTPPSFMHKWKEMNPDYEYMLWDNESIKRLDLINGRVMRLYRLDNRDCWNGRSNVLRLEILKKYGGIYIDADCDPQRPLDDELLDNDFFVCYINEDKRGKRINNAVIGCGPNHHIINEYIAAVGKVKKITERSWRQTGPLLFTNVCKPYDITRYPSYYFEPNFHHGNEEYTGSFKPYSHHYWGTTKSIDFGKQVPVTYITKKAIAIAAKSLAATKVSPELVRYYQYWSKGLNVRFEYIDKVINVLRNLGVGSVLEVGTGPGNLKLSSVSTSIDINPEFKPDIVHDATKIPWPAKKADAVVSLQTFEHFGGKQPQVFREAWRLAKKCVIISIPYMWKTKDKMHANLDDATMLSWAGVRWTCKFACGNKHKRVIYVWLK